MEVRIKRAWFDTQKLSNVCNHASLLIQHGVSDGIVNETLEHRDAQVIGLGLEGSDRGVSLQLLMVSDKNQLFQAFQHSSHDSTF